MHRSARRGVETVAVPFTEWADGAEPRVRHALTASFGPQIGVDATADAMAHAWEHWDEIRTKDNPVGYVFGVGRNKARRMTRRRPVYLEVPAQRLPDVEPALPGAIAALPEKQRIVVGLVHGYGWSLAEVAELLGVAKTTVQNHAERGLARLREILGVEL